VLNGKKNTMKKNNVSVHYAVLKYGVEIITYTIFNKFKIKPTEASHE